MLNKFLILLLLTISLSGCGLMMLPMLCDAPGSCGHEKSKQFDGGFCVQDADCVSNHCGNAVCSQY